MTPARPAPPRPWSPLRTPTFWLLLVVFAIGLVGLVLVAGLYAWPVPRTALATTPLIVAYACASLLLIRQLDHLARRSWWLVAMAFGWGATAAVAFGGGVDYFLDNVLAKVFDPWFAADWGAAIVAPIGEEIAKGVGVALLILAARPHLRTVLSGAVYGAIIGVGFAALEDATYVLGAADETLPDNGPEALRVLALRVVVPGLASHPLFTAVAGAGIAYFAVRTDRSRGRRFAMLGAAFGLAGLMHAAVNSPLALLASDALDRLPGFGALAGYFLVVGAPTVVALRWLASLRRAEAVRCTARLADPAGAAATGAEASTLASIRRRVRAVRDLRRTYGVPAARAARRVQRAQLRLLDLPPDPPHPAPAGGLAATHRFPVATVPPGVGPFTGGPAVVGPAVVGPAVVGPAVVGPAVVGPAVVGPAVAGPGPAEAAPMNAPAATAGVSGAVGPGPAELAPLTPPPVPAGTVPAVPVPGGVMPAVPVPGGVAPAVPVPAGMVLAGMAPAVPVAAGVVGAVPVAAGVVGAVPVGWQPQLYLPRPYPGMAYPPAEWRPPPVRPTRAQRARTELDGARESLAGLIGSAEVPAPAVEPRPVPSWLPWGAIGLAAVGLVHWAAVLLAALVVAVPTVAALRRRQPIADRLLWAAVAVSASAYIWLASLLIMLLFPEGF